MSCCASSWTVGSLSSSRSDLASLKALSIREWPILVLAAVAVPTSHLLLRAVGYRRTRRLGERLSLRRATPPNAPARATSTTRLVWAVDQRLPGSRTCLSRSLALWYLLLLQGVRTELRIGVRPGGAPLDAHAWVEHDGRPLNDDEGVAHRFATLQPDSRAP